MFLRHLLVVAACLPMAFFSPGLLAQEAANPPPEKLDLHKPSVATSGKWQFRYDITAPGTRSEGRWGWLSYDGKRLPPAGVNDYYETPWGRLYWGDSPAVPWGNHGWMSQPVAQAAKGKQLTSPEEIAPQIDLTMADDGKTVEISSGELLAIRLAGNPTTGFRWQQAEQAGSAIEAVGEPQYVPKPVKPGIVGSGGEFVFLYKAVKPGDATVKLQYSRPWEKDTPAAKTFGATIKVAAAAKPVDKNAAPAKNKKSQ